MEVLLPVDLDALRLSIATYVYNASGGFLLSQVYVNGSAPAATVIGNSVVSGGLWRLVTVELPTSLLNASDAGLYAVGAIITCDAGGLGETDFVAFGYNVDAYPFTAVDGPLAGEAESE